MPQPNEKSESSAPILQSEDETILILSRPLIWGMTANIVRLMTSACKKNQQLGFSDSITVARTVVSLSRAMVMSTVRSVSSGMSSLNMRPP